MNQTDDQRGSAGLTILWPDTSNQHFKAALADANAGVSYNNVSAVIRYSMTDGVSFLWLGIGLKLNMPKAETSQLTLSDNRCPLELFREIPSRTSYYTSRPQVAAQGCRPEGTPGFERRTRPPTK
jgi:hypothetical protein